MSGGASEVEGEVIGRPVFVRLGLGGDVNRERMNATSGIVTGFLGLSERVRDDVDHDAKTEAWPLAVCGAASEILEWIGRHAGLLHGYGAWKLVFESIQDYNGLLPRLCTAKRNVSRTQ